MHEYAVRAQLLLEGRTLEQLVDDIALQMAVLHAIQTIGEAASRLSRPLRDAHPEIDWSGMIAMRNIIVHQYGEVNIRIIWLTVTDEMPALLSALEAMLEEFR